MKGLGMQIKRTVMGFMCLKTKGTSFKEIGLKISNKEKGFFSTEMVINMKGNSIKV